jgi:multidrug efflux system membrane fusion protein
MKTPSIVPGLLLALALAGGCSRSDTAKGPPPAPVLAAAATTKTLPVQIDPAPVGHVMPILSVTVRPQIGGVIHSVHFKEGQSVMPGDLLFTIDPRPAQAALTLAKGNLQRDLAQLENAKIQFARDAKLFEQKLVSQDVFDTSKAALEALTGTVGADRAAVTNAELNLQYTEIRAPIDGRTGGLLFHAGNVVKAPDDELVSINQIHPIYATFAVAERYLPEIRKQMRDRTLAVTATYENLAGEPPQGELTFVNNAVDEMTGTIQLKATFPNADERLWPGQFVQIALLLGELTNAVVVPSQAVQAGQSGPFVFVVKVDQTVEMRPVKTGITVKGETAIAAGLQAGETVVTDGHLRLAPGVKVSVAVPAGSIPTNAVGK